MMNKNNTYFENLYKIGCEWEAAREERRARKQTIIDTFGWDSEEIECKEFIRNDCIVKPASHRCAAAGLTIQSFLISRQ